MKTIILNHRVNDFNEWKKHFEADSARRVNAGLTEIAVGTKSGDPQQVYIIWQAASTDSIKKMMSDPDLKDAMQKAGVISEPEVVFVD